MSAYLLDSNHAGTLVTPMHDVYKRVTAQMAAGDIFCLALPVVTEVVFGFSILPRATQNWREWRAIRPSLMLIGLDENDLLDAASLQVLLRRQGRQLHTVDALIATVALRYKLTLLTTDKDFQPVPALVTENWMIP